MQIVAFALATVIPLAVLITIRALDLYQTGSFTTVLYCTAWGALAFAGAYFINSAVYEAGLVSDWNMVARFVAPPVEEILKCLVLVYLVRRPNFTYFVDGAIYGFAAGVGFAVVENYQYLLAAPDAAFSTALGRVVSTNLIHACATALVGVSLGLARFQPGFRKWLTFGGGLLAAILLHGAFNNLVALIVDGPVLFFATVIALAALAVIAVLIFRGLAQSRRWIEDKLGTGDRVTMGEARVVRKLEDVQELLKPLRGMFGEQKTLQIEQLLFTQARLGIQRAALDKLPDENMRRATQRQIDALTTEMEALRRSIGTYTMLAVRQIIPEDAGPMWDLLKSRIQQQIESRPASGGANLFASLGKKMSPLTPAGSLSEPPSSPDSGTGDGEPGSRTGSQTPPDPERGEPPPPPESGEGAGGVRANTPPAWFSAGRLPSKPQSPSNPAPDPDAPTQKTGDQ